MKFHLFQASLNFEVYCRCLYKIYNEPRGDIVSTNYLYIFFILQSLHLHKIFVNCLRSSSFFTGRHFEFERGEKERNHTFKQKRCTNIRRAHHSAKELKTYTKEEKGKKGKSRKNQNQKTKSAVSRKLVIRVKAFLFYTALKKDIEYPFPNC